MADLVDVRLEDDRWLAAGLGRLAQNSCGATLQHLGINPVGFEIGLLGCDDQKIAALNADFRDKNTATNVLAWPAQNLAAGRAGAKPGMPAVRPDTGIQALGDIAIAFETCRQEAQAADRDLGQHVSHLLVHATLHLLGYDHIARQDAALMQDLESKVLATMGIPDPYGDV